MPEPLTSRQRELLAYLRFRQKIRSYRPTVREIGEAVGLSSSSTVQNHLNTLERKGHIRRDPSKSRAIELVERKSADRRERQGQVIVIPQQKSVKIGRTTINVLIRVEAVGHA